MAEIKAKKALTEKQRLARIENLKKGRQTIADNKKKRLENKEQEYDIDSSSEEDSESDEEDTDFIISKAPKKDRNVPKEKEKKKGGDKQKPDKLREDVDQLKALTTQLIEMQKKKTKRPRREASNKIVILPQPATSSSNHQTSQMEALRRALYGS